MKKFLSGIFLAVMFGTVYSQTEYVPGYIILEEGDSIGGEIKVNRKKMYQLNEKVYFKISEADKKSYRPNKVKEFGLEGDRYISIKVNDEDSYFLKLVSNGIIKLYEQKVIILAMNKEVEKSDYYVQKDKQELTLLKSNRFKKQMEELIYDHEELMQEVEDKKYEFDDVVKVVQSYNTWFSTPGN